MRFLFSVPGSPVVGGMRKGDYAWNPRYGKFLYKGEPTDIKDFDTVSKLCFGSPLCKILPPTVCRCPDDPPEAPPVGLGLEPEEDLGKALELIERMAPHRLKAKTGPKPVMATA